MAHEPLLNPARLRPTTSTATALFPHQARRKELLRSHPGLVEYAYGAGEVRQVNTSLDEGPAGPPRHPALGQG